MDCCCHDANIAYKWIVPPLFFAFFILSFSYASLVSSYFFCCWHPKVANPFSEKKILFVGGENWRVSQTELEYSSCTDTTITSIILALLFSCFSNFIYLLKICSWCLIIRTYICNASFSCTYDPGRNWFWYSVTLRRVRKKCVREVTRKEEDTHVISAQVRTLRH